MINLNEMHNQEISDILSAARLCLCENQSSIHAQMFRSMFGGLFVGQAKPFGEKYAAYEANASLVPTVLVQLAEQMNMRGM